MVQPQEKICPKCGKPYYAMTVVTYVRFTHYKRGSSRVRRYCYMRGSS